MEKTTGVYNKYTIQKTDGSKVDPNAKYFVLRIDKPENEIEREAIRYYADRQIERGDSSFGMDLYKRLTHWDIPYPKTVEDLDREQVAKTVKGVSIYINGTFSLWSEVDQIGTTTSWMELLIKHLVDQGINVAKVNIRIPEERMTVHPFWVEQTNSWNWRISRD